MTWGLDDRGRQDGGEFIDSHKGKVGKDDMVVWWYGGMIGMCLKQSDGEVHAHPRQDTSFSISISIHSSNLNSHLRR
jgi:hypothetical protein